MDGKALLSVKRLQKRFGEFFSLEVDDFSVFPGKIHGLVGVNGAGKSLLLNILSGLVSPDDGEITVNGEPQQFSTPLDAQSKGIVCIHQNINLVEDLTVAENIYLGNLPEGFLGKIDWKFINESAQTLLDTLKFPISATAKVAKLNLASRRMVEIARAFRKEPKVLLMDEPLALLSISDAQMFFPALSWLCEHGVGIVYVSHNLESVIEWCDAITVLCKGKISNRVDVSTNTDIRSLVMMMSGVNYKHNYPKLPSTLGRTLLEVKGICSRRSLDNVSFHVRKGEILGIAGMLNSGRTAIARALFGLDRITDGQISMNDTRLDLKNPDDAIAAGIGYLPENRMDRGLIGNLSVPPNITITSLEDVRNLTGLDLRREEVYARNYVKKLVIDTPFLHANVGVLSAGNQQKIHLAKWLFAGCNVLILEEPTQSIDLASKNDIYNYMGSFVQSGASIILISSDLQELMGLSDRILTLCRGKVTKEFHRGEFNAEDIMWHATLNNENREGKDEGKEGTTI
ncbi:MAG: D-xylose ABC transporter ATP-binding protein [Spirochaetae bacterium HGW-Spirochaetae-4]|nr:MAG: D-xylose ABC transporter ATP-binding protein [Spirochaetae bacterium HGW-Spirochaetae-4]